MSIKVCGAFDSLHKIVSSEIPIVDEDHKEADISTKILPKFTKHVISLIDKNSNSSVELERLKTSVQAIVDLYGKEKWESFQKTHEKTIEPQKEIFAIESNSELQDLFPNLSLALYCIFQRTNLFDQEDLPFLIRWEDVAKFKIDPILENFSSLPLDKQVRLFEIIGTYLHVIYFPDFFHSLLVSLSDYERFKEISYANKDIDNLARVYHYIRSQDIEPKDENLRKTCVRNIEFFFDHIPSKSLKSYSVTYAINDLFDNDPISYFTVLSFKLQRGDFTTADLWLIIFNIQDLSPAFKELFTLALEHLCADASLLQTWPFSSENHESIVKRSLTYADISALEKLVEKVKFDSLTSDTQKKVTEKLSQYTNPNPDAKVKISAHKSNQFCGI